MRKIALGILVLGTMAMAANSEVSANANKLYNNVKNTRVSNSTVGMQVKADDSKVAASANIVTNRLNRTRVQNSNVGLKIDAKDGSNVQTHRNSNYNNIKGGSVVGSTVGVNVKAKKSKVRANYNRSTNVLKNSHISNSNVGLDIQAK
jgi:hypothetical protein